MQMKKWNRKNGGYKAKSQAEWFYFYMRTSGEDKAQKYLEKIQTEKMTALMSR